MNDNSLSLLIKAMLDSKSTSDILTQIEQIQQKINANPLNFKINIDSKEFNQLAASLEKIGNSMGKALNVNTSGLDKVSVTMNTTTAGYEFMEKKVKEITNAQGQLVKEVSKFKQEVDEAGNAQTVLVKRTEETTDNFKKLRQEQQKLFKNNQNNIYSEIEKTTKTVYDIQRKLLTSGEQETSELQKQLKFHNDKLSALIKEKSLNGYDDTTRNQSIYQQELGYIEKYRLEFAKLGDQKTAIIERDHAAALKMNAQYDANIAKQKQKTAEIQKQIDLYKQRMLGGNGFTGELDIFADKQKGKFDETALAKIRADVEALNVSTPDLNNKIKKTGIEFSSLKQQASQSGNVMTRALDNAFKFLRFYLVGGLLVGVVGAFRDAVNVVVELDKSLTELNKVADLTDNQLQNVTTRAYEMGKSIGRTGKDVIDATAEWVRAGYDIEDAFTLSEQSLLLTNIGDGITDVKEASSSLIAILKGFKMEAGDTAHVVDSLNEVSNRYALDTNNLTEILKRASGTIAQTGTSYEELIGLATGGFESLRNAEMVASGINMISQRKILNNNAKLLGVASYVQKCA